MMDLTIFEQDTLATYLEGDDGFTLIMFGSSLALMDGGGDLLAANNLSDLASAPTARTNLSVYSMAQTDSAIAAAVVGLWDDKGPIDCSANPNYPAASKSDTYRVTVAGKIGGASGTSVDAGDVIVASADNAGGTQAAVGSNWYVVEHNIIGGAPLTAASTSEVLTGTDATKGVTPDALAALWEQGSDVASAGTVSLDEGGYFNITGTTTITDIDFATDKAGRKAWVKFAGILTLTHGANLILPTGANIATAAGDTACFISEGSDVVRCVAYTRASGAALVASSFTGGKQTIPLLASAMTPRTTNGAAEGTSESTTNKVMRRTLDFDASTAEYAQIVLPMPKSWDEGTITAQFVWEAPGGTGNVVWAIQCLCLSDDDVIDTAFGTAISVTDGVTATTDVMISAETSAVTASNSPAEGDLMVVQVYRDAANGSDTLASDAKLIAVKLFITTNAATDA
jgi:hypothetical protein